MSLRNVKPTEEETSTETVVETPVVETQEVATVTQATTPVVVQESRVPSIASLENFWNPEEYGNLFPRVKGSNGGLNCDGTMFGSYMDIQVISHSKRIMIVPIPKEEKDKKDLKKFCRASYDGKTIPDRDGGEPTLISDYIESIKDFYPLGCKISSYYDIFCICFNSEKAKEAAIGKNVMQVSVSPTSIKAFKAFAAQVNLSVKRGLMLASHQNCMRVIADAHSDDRGDYVTTSFGNTPVEILQGYEVVLDY